MLRPTRRSGRSLASGFALLFSLAMIWPAGISSAAQAPHRDPAASGVSAGAASDRRPVTASRGIKAADAGRGQRPNRPLKDVTIDRTRRPAPEAESGTNRAIRHHVSTTVLATDSGAPAAANFGPWAGLDRTSAAASCATGQPGGCGPLEPPDPWVAVGPDDVVQTVNTDIKFTNREGTQTVATLDAYEFFNLDEVDFIDNAGTHHFDIDGYADPRWHFDQRHNRWLGLMMGWHCDSDGTGADEESTGFVFGAISLTDDPTGDYYQFIIRETGYFRDYPMLGTSGDKLTVATNDYEMAAGADCLASAGGIESSVTSFSWAEMLLYPADLFPEYYYFGGQYFSPRPAFAPQSQSNAIFGVIEYIAPAQPADSSNVAYFKITGTVTKAATDGTSVQIVDLSGQGMLEEFKEPPTPIDPGGPLDPGIVDRRPTDAIWQDNVLTFTTTGPCDPAGGGAENRACARVTQLNTSPVVPTLVQDMLIGTTGKDTWYPGIGESQSGILHVVYTQSSQTEGMSSYDRYQLPADPANTLSAPRLIASGGAVIYNGNRWGDYVGVAQDPRDTNAVWQGNQHTKSDGTWATTVSQLQTAGSVFVGIAPVRLLDSRAGNGTTGAFTSSVPKSVDIAGRGGVPNNAVAITGNLTVVGQQGAGYAALTPLPAVNPTTSTINFPLGDIRANNVTSPLSNAGGVSLTYKAGAGQRAHLILDVTGYFLNGDVGHTYKTPITPLRVLDTRGDVGLTNRMPANLNRSFQVAGVGAIPLGAKAITGNLTVVNQTAAGYVTLSTDEAPATPATSTINFPVGDIRANGVTVKLNNDGRLWAVYKATGGQFTHLILDVTGYYVDDLTGARFVPLTPGRRLDTRFPAPLEGLTGTFKALTARTLVIEPYQGVPANATAITGNLTVVGQTQAGYVAMTPIADNTPETSSLNFPVGDIRANGVTGPLSGPGSVGLVYMAAGGRTTHLILDLTGYFRLP